jgi:hypothetical protein
MMALVWLKRARYAMGSRMNQWRSRSCAERKAQAEAGPLMLIMVRRANMGFP